MREVHDQAHDSVVHRIFSQAVDKGLVDLQVVDRKILHVVQRRVTATEVVEGYSDPQDSEVPEKIGIRHATVRIGQPRYPTGIVICWLNGTRGLDLEDILYAIIQVSGEARATRAEDYPGILIRRQAELHRLIFAHGVSVILAPSFGTETLKRGEAYARYALGGLARLPDDEVYLTLIDSGARIRF